MARNGMGVGGNGDRNGRRQGNRRRKEEASRPEWGLCQVDSCGGDSEARSAAFRHMVELPKPGRPLGEFAADLGKILSRHEIFRRGDQACRINQDTGRLEPMTPRYFRTWAERHVSFFKKTTFPFTMPPAVFLQICSMTADVAGAVLASPQFLEELRPLDSVAPVRMPVMRPDGKIGLLAAGYDADRRVWTNPDGCPFDENMSPEEARGVIDEALKEFAFADDGGRSRTVSVAAMLSVFAATLLPRGTPRPCFIITANGEGSGKSMLAKLCAGATHGICEPSAGPESEEGWRKLLFAEALAGSQLAIFDNLKTHLDSPALEAFLTSTRFKDRVLRKSAMAVGQSVLTVIITGNGLTISADLRRRSLFAELRIAELRPEDREFECVLDDAAILEMRPRLLAAMWALIRSWDRAGRPDASRGNASFPRWCSTIGAIVEHAGFGCPNVPADIPGSGDPDLADLLELMGAMDEARRYKFAELVELCRERGLFERFTGNADSGTLGPTNRSAFAKLLKRYDGRRNRDGGALCVLGKGKSRRYMLHIEGGADARQPEELVAA